MKSTIFLMLLFVTSNLYAQVAQKPLLYLSDFETPGGSTRDSEIICYPSLDLLLHQSDNSIVIYAKSKPVLLIARKGYTNRFQVFDSAFLLVSIVKGVSAAATPNDFQRDSTFIVDLSTGNVKFVKGDNFYLVNNKEVLMGLYPRTSAQEKGPHMGFCVVESIDFEKSNMVLLSRMQKTREIHLENVDKVFPK